MHSKIFTSFPVHYENLLGPKNDSLMDLRMEKQSSPVSRQVSLHSPGHRQS